MNTPPPPPAAAALVAVALLASLAVLAWPASGPVVLPVAAASAVAAVSILHRAGRG